jgi:uncharacterized Zn-finger protein
MPISEHFPLNLAHVVALTAQFLGDRYERNEVHLCLHRDDFSDVSYITIKGGQITLPFRHTDMSVGGLRKPFLCKRYGWFIRPFDGSGEGVLKATYDVVGQESEGTFKFALTNEADGVWRGRILPIDAAGNVIAGPECYLPFYFWIDGNHTAKDVPLHIAQTDSFEWMHETDAYSLNLPPVYHAAVLPKRTAFLPHPLPVNVAPFPLLPSGTLKSQLSRINLGPAMDEGNRFYPMLTDRGIWVTENAQGYYFSEGPIDFLSPLPFLPLMDGPRNVATYGFTTDVWQGRDRKFYHSTPYSRRVVDSRGEVRTLFGLYSKYPAYWGDLVRAAAKGVLHPSLGIRGNWPGSTRPREQQFPLRSWFEFFLPWTVTKGTGTPVQDATMVVPESPHPIGTDPTSVVGDDHGWILEVVYDGNDHTKEPDVYERYKVDRLFGGKFHTDNLLYVVERAKHRVLAIDPKTWKLVRVVIDGGAAAAALGTINAQDDTFRFAAGKTMADARAVGCVDITGLDIAGDWLYLGSMAMGGVFRVNLLDGTRQWCRTILTGFQSHFINVRVMADHTLFTCTFDNQYFGHPRAWLPVADATQTHSQAWDWAYFGYDQAQGVGSTGTLVDIYPMSMSVTKDAIAVGGSQEGFAVFVKRDPSETIPDATKMRAGHREYNGAALYLQYGRFGMGAEPAPAGLTLNSDYWLTANGITPGALPAPTPAPPPVPPTTQGPPMFNVTKVGTTTYPPLPTAGQRGVFKMHGSSGGFNASGDLINGDQWAAATDASFGSQTYDLHAYSGGAYGSTLTPANPAAYTVFAPVDRSILGKNLPSETCHLGYMHDSPGGKVFSDYTARAYAAWVAWAPTQYTQVDWSKGIVIHDTNSMGSWGTLTAIERNLFGDVLVAAFFTQPRYQIRGVADFEANQNDVTIPAGLKCDDGADTATRYNAIKYASDLNNPLPFLCFTNSLADAFTPKEDAWAFVAALQARIRNPQATNVQRTGLGFGQAPGVHGATGPGSPVANALMGSSAAPTGYNWRRFEKGLGYPIFDRSTRDDDLSDITRPGFVARGFDFTRPVEAPDSWSCKVYSQLFDAPIGAYVDKAGYPAGVSSVNLDARGTGQFIPGDAIRFQTQTEAVDYVVTNNVDDVIRGGALTFTPALVNPIPAGLGGSPIAIIVKRAATPRPGSLQVDIWPHSNVFVQPVTQPLRVTVKAGEWADVSFPAAVVAPPPPPPPAPPTIDSFVVTPTSGKVGDTVTLTWSSTGADSATLNGLVVQPSTTKLDTPQQDTTYTLVVTGAGGTATQSVTVAIRPLTTDENVANLLREARVRGWPV